MSSFCTTAETEAKVGMVKFVTILFQGFSSLCCLLLTSVSKLSLPFVSEDILFSNSN